MRIAHLAVAGLLLWAGPAQAQTGPLCAPRERVAEHLGATFKEAPVARGATTGGALMEVFASDAGSFTIVITRNGISCLAVTGEGWGFVFAKPTGPGA